jgi:hypothetical protein
VIESPTWTPERMRMFARQFHEVRGERGSYAPSRLRLKARKPGESESLAPLADNLAGCIKPGSNDVVRQSFICEENNPGPNYIAIR